jgi:hypothetical protein
MPQAICDCSLHRSIYLSISVYLSTALQPSGIGRYFGFFIYIESVWLLWREISRRKASTHTQNNTTHIDIHALSGIRTQDPSVWASEDSSCIRQRDRDRRSLHLLGINLYSLGSKTLGYSVHRQWNTNSKNRSPYEAKSHWTGEEIFRPLSKSTDYPLQWLKDSTTGNHPKPNKLCLVP